jgi:hypothetical protein
MVSEKELTEIEERNNERRRYRAELPPGLWLYDSFAFLENRNDVVTGGSDLF